MASFRDYYKTLGIERTATKEDIRRAFRKLAAKHHPDRNPNDPGAEERFKEINEAYTVLADEEKRKFYDQYGTDGPAAASPGGGQWTGGTWTGSTRHSNVSPEEFAGFSDFFQSLFGGFAASATSASYAGGMPGGYATEQGGYVGEDPFQAFERPSRFPQRLTDAHAHLDVGLLDAYRGGPTTIRIDGKELELTIPPGTRHGAKLRLRGQAPGGGDLILEIRHLNHPTLKLSGDDVRSTAKVPAHVAALGGSATVDTLEGPISLSVPAGSSGGRVLRLKGQGWPRKEGGRGDALVELRLTVPKDLSSEQRELYQRLAELDAAT